MKKAIVIMVVSIHTFGLVSCQPAAETEEHMHAVASRTRDSIANWLDSSLNDPFKTLAEGSIKINTVTTAPAEK